MIWNLPDPKVNPVVRSASSPLPSGTNVDALREVIEFLDQGVAVFDSDACLLLANSSFHIMYPSLNDVLKPGVSWHIFLREAVHRGIMPAPVSQRLDQIETGISGDPNLTDPVQMPSTHGQAFTLKIGQTTDGGFTLTQSIVAAQTSEADAAREAEALLRKVLEACPTSLTMSRITDGQIIYRSPAATDLLGNAKSSFAHFANNWERADFVTLLLPDGTVDNMRVTCLRPDGQEFPAELSARLIDYRGEDVIVANIEDLTNELAVQSEMDRQKEQLFQSEKLSALGELLAGIAHELNNPLSIVVGNADILEEELENTGLKRRVEKLSTAAHRCVRIVRSFLSLTRQEPLDLQTITAARLIETALEATSTDVEAAGIKVITTYASDCPPALADDVQFPQVIINLLINAVHAIQDAGIGDLIKIDCGPAEGMLRFTVADNGPGISDELKTRVFDPLFTTKEAGKGTGVGLAFCLRIVTAHRGQISLENTKGQGASFIIDLPLA